MTISSILPGRIPLSLLGGRLERSISQGQFELNRLQEQIGTGKQFTLPSEAPTAATQTLILQKLVERRESFQASVRTNQGFLGAADQSLATIGDALNTARGLLQAGLGDQANAAEREGLADQVNGLLQSVLQAGNAQYNGRSIFAGARTDQIPFEQIANGAVRYNGDGQAIYGFADFGILVNNSVDGVNGLRATSTALSADINPTLSLTTRLEDLHRGQGAPLGQLQVILANTPTEVRQTIDLSAAETIGDVKTLIENAFNGEPLTITVDLDPTSQMGLRLTPSAGTVEVREVQAGTTAERLRIRSGPVATLIGSDVDPRLSLFTPVASLNGGTGIGATAGTGLQIVNGPKTSVIDLDGAVTVQDVLNRIQAADPDLIVGFSSEGTGLAITTRLSGVDFSIGENGGSNATLLGIRTLTGSTKLADLNFGVGVPKTDTAGLKVTRRDGSQVTVDVSSATTIQDVLGLINAVDPGNLVASLKSVGNGIQLTDNSGVGPLTIASTAVSAALGLAGSENSGPTGVLAGTDPNPQESTGAVNLLARLNGALRNNDRATLSRLADRIDAESNRISVVRADVGSRQNLLADVDNRLEDAYVDVKQTLSKIYDVDVAAAVSAFLQRQQALQASMQVSSRSMQLSILQFL